MNELLEKIVEDMNLIPIDDSYRNIHQATYDQEIDDKYKYRTLDGYRIYSPEFLLNMHEEGERK